MLVASPTSVRRDANCASVRIAVLSLIAISACRGFGPVPPDLSARLDARALPSHGTGESTVEIDSNRLAGSFRALIAWRSDPPSARLQLWPDLGDKVFDCASSGHFWVAQSNRHAWEESERHPFRFFAMTILERATPLTSHRVLGARRGLSRGATSRCTRGTTSCSG